MSHNSQLFLLQVHISFLFSISIVITILATRVVEAYMSVCVNCVLVLN